MSSGVRVMPSMFMFSSRWGSLKVPRISSTFVAVGQEPGRADLGG